MHLSGLHRVRSQTAKNNRRKTLLWIAVVIVCCWSYWKERHNSLLSATITYTNEQATVALSLNEMDNTNKLDNTALNENKLRNTNEQENAVTVGKTWDNAALNENKLRNTNEQENAVTVGKTWCSNVATARSELDPSLRITYPCEKLPQATSAVVCFLTAGVEEGKGSRTIYTAKEYVNGALALGASLQKHITRKDTHQLLLIRDGFSIPAEDRSNLEAVGWTLGVAPKVEVEREYLPSFERYKTTYTKISAIGLSEYKCTLLMDADAIAVGSLDDLLSCKTFDRPEYRVAGTLDFYHKQWQHFNTGSILWRSSAYEMNHVYNLTRDSSFMKKFGSDQIFLNNVYPFRIDISNNKLILEDKEGATKESWGAVARLPWDYNAQTHVQVQLPEYWEKNAADMKIIHFTEKKGWMCPDKDSPPTAEEMQAKDCNKNIPLCFCHDGYRWWNLLREAQERGRTKKL